MIRKEGHGNCLWDHKFVLLADRLNRGDTVTGKVYYGTRERLRKAIRSKRPGLLRQGLNIFHHNVGSVLPRGLVSSHSASAGRL
jgi:hypothetical protein